MFERVTVTASDLDASRRFYATVLATIGVDDWGDFVLAEGPDVTTGLHLGFAAPSREHVDAFWRAGVDAGYPDDGEPGPRPVYGPTYYGGFLLDPDGNSAEAVHRAALRTEGVVDHLWLRVSDLDASAGFFRSVPGIEQVHALEGERVHFGGGPHGGTFAVVADGRPVTRNVALAFAGDAPWSGRSPDGLGVEVVRR
jgi:catechol 2,3-dioxygenase-like lactoylglutathione lyase family enzyme